MIPFRSFRLPGLIISLLILQTSCTIQADGTFSYEETRIPASEFREVRKVVDGDTFWVNDGSEKGLKVRLIGVDAPESRKAFNHDVEYFGKEAKEYMTKLIGNKKVRLVSDVSPTDRYGRTLAYVYLEDGTFVNADLISNGYAVLMTISPNVQYAEQFAELQREARESGRGLWAQEGRASTSLKLLGEFRE